MSDPSIASRLSGKTPSVSFEFFPPKNEKMPVSSRCSLTLSP